MLRRKLSTCLMGAAVVIAAPDGAVSANPVPVPPFQSVSSVGARLRDRPGCDDRGSLNVWRYGEPSLDDLLNDPIVHLLMKRDGVSRDFLESLVRSVQCNLTGPS